MVLEFICDFGARDAMRQPYYEVLGKSRCARSGNAIWVEGLATAYGGGERGERRGTARMGGGEGRRGDTEGECVREGGRGERKRREKQGTRNEGLVSHASRSRGRSRSRSHSEAEHSRAEQSRAGGLLGTYLGYKDKDLKRRTKMTASACRRGRQAGRQAGE
jgi:hypothetical protein